MAAKFFDLDQIRLRPVAIVAVIYKMVPRRYLWLSYNDTIDIYGQAIAGKFKRDFLSNDSEIMSDFEFENIFIF